MQFSAEFLLQVILAVGAPVAVYAGIKQDLATLTERATQAAASATRAHERIDHFHNQKG